MSKGIIVQFRRGRHTFKPRHFLINVGAHTREEAKRMCGKHVAWTSSSGKIIQGVIQEAHGNKGLVRAIFKKGLPGQALTGEVNIE